MRIGAIISRRSLLRPAIITLGLWAAPLALAAEQAAPAPDKPAAPATPAAPTPAAPAAEAAKPDVSSADGSIQQEEVAARTVVDTHGSASWEEGYSKINEAIARLRAAAQKAGLKENGRPMAVFTEADDANFKFDAMLPVDAPADAKPDLTADVSLAQSPSGKALRFQHRGPYDDIDSTYEAITAYMDEKGLEARNLFVEEYLNDPKDSGDANAQVDIHVFLK